MPLYNTATAAAALGVTPKWLDNLLSHNKIDGVTGARQGVPRRLSGAAVELVAIVRDLSSVIGVPISSAVVIAQQILHEHGRNYAVSPAVVLSVDVRALTHEVASSLARAVELTPQRTRGRPRHPTGETR